MAKEREIVVEFIEPEGEAESGYTNQEGNPELSGPSIITNPVEEDTSPSYLDEDSTFEMPRIEGEPLDVLSSNSEDIFVADPPPPQLVPVTKSLADSESFYALHLLQPENAEEEHTASTNQLIEQGESDLVNEAREVAKIDDDESNELAIESIISDPTIPEANRKAILENYMNRGYLPITLKEKYIYETSIPNPNTSIATNDSQTIVFDNLTDRLNDNYAKIRRADIEKQDIGNVAAFLAGVDHIWDGAGIQLQGGSQEEYNAGMAEFRRIQEEYGLATSAGQLAGIVVPTIPIILGGAGVVTTVTLAALVAAIIDGTSRFSELTYDGVDYETKLTASLAQSGTTALDFSIPILRGISVVKTMMWNGGVNVVMGELNVTLQNYILEAFPELKQPQFDFKNMTANALFGMIIGFVFGRPPKRLAEPMKDMGIPHDSVYASANVADPALAKEMILENIKNDKTGTITTKMNGGVGVEGIVYGSVLPNIHPMNVKGNTIWPEIQTEINAIFKSMDTDARRGFARTWFNPFYGKPTMRWEDLKTVFDVRREFDAIGNHMPANSSLGGTNITDTTSEGTDLFGTVKHRPFPTRKGAERFASTLQKRIDATHYLNKHNSQVESGLEIIEKDGGHIVLWNWKKDYEPLNMGMLNTQPIHLLGWDATKFSNTYLGDKLISHGKHNLLESGAMINIEQHAALTKVLQKQIPALIAGHKQSRELDALINEAEEAHRDFYGASELTQMFPHLRQREIQELYKVWSVWGRMIDIEFMFLNRQYRNMKADLGMEALWRIRADGTEENLGLVTRRILPEELAELNNQGKNTYEMMQPHPELIRTGNKVVDLFATDNGLVRSKVWDFENSISVQYNKEAIDAAGKILVKLDEPMFIDKKGIPEIHRFALVNKELKFNFMAEELLPRIKGYAPRTVNENYFVDMTPRIAIVDGKEVKIKSALYALFKRTMAGTRTREEGDAVVRELQKKHPEYEFLVRAERKNRFQLVVDDVKIRHMMMEESKSRGERVLGGDGNYARIDDRLVGVGNSIDSMVKMEIWGPFEVAFRNSFKMTFGDMYDGDELPLRISDIKQPIIPSEENLQRYKDAIARFKYFQMLNQFQTKGDLAWNEYFHSLAEKIERFTYPAKISMLLTKEIRKNPLSTLGKTAAYTNDALMLQKQVIRYTADKVHHLGNTGNLAVKIPKQVVTAAYIHLNPVRQWMIQPAQLREIWLVHPSSFVQTVRQMVGIRAAIMGQAPMLSQYEKIFTYLGRKGSGMDDQDFNEKLNFIITSGMLDGISTNTLVTDMLQGAKTMLVEDKADLMQRIITNTVMAVPRATREVGYDFAELSQRIGMGLQTIEMWREQNPTLDWRTIENQAIIAAEALKLSGAMNRGGLLNYQEGVLSIFFQFAAIQQKLTMNLFQDSATILTRDDRIRIGAVRFVLYGGKYGIPAAVFLGWVYNELSDEPFISDPVWRQRFERGIVDWFVNKLFGMFTRDTDVGKSDGILAGKGLTPYPEMGLPQIQGLYEIYKLVDGNPATNPRFAALGLGSSILQTIQEMQGWTHRKDISSEEKYIYTLREAAEFASMLSNFEKGLVQFQTRQFLSKSGKTIDEGGLQLTPHKGEAIYKMIFGGENNKQHQIYEASKYTMEHDKNVKDMAKRIHEQLQSIYIKNKEATEGTDIYNSKISAIQSFFTHIEGTYFTNEDKLTMMKELIKLDRRASKSVGQSVLLSILRNKTEAISKESRLAEEALENSGSEAAQKILRLIKNKDEL